MIYEIYFTILHPPKHFFPVKYFLDLFSLPYCVCLSQDLDNKSSCTNTQ